MIWGVLLVCAALLGALGGWVLRRTRHPARDDAAERLRADAAEQKARHLLQMLERDRRRVAQRLHNGPIQDLLAADMETHVASYLGESSVAALDVAPVVRRLRAISEGFEPPSLHAFGLAAALATCTARFEREHPEMTVGLDAAPLRGVSLPTELALFRIVQEALDNVSRHAGASRVDISLARTPAGIDVCVRDDGRGWEVPPDAEVLAEQGRYGVFGMKAHAESVGGILRVDSTPGSTSVHAVVPDTPPPPHAHPDPHPHRR